MRLEDFNFDLPSHLVAQRPLAQRSECRLLCLNRRTGAIQHYQFKDLGQLLTPTDLLIFNNTKVIPARLYAAKKTGGRVELLIEKILDHERVLAQTKSCSPLRIGEQLYLADEVFFRTVSREGELWQLQLQAAASMDEVLERFGQVPIPPYLKRLAEVEDRENYQTVYATDPGSVAAPTAGLHFDQALLTQLKLQGIQQTFLTLHIGLGTFQPIRSNVLSEHKMHTEQIEITTETCKLVNETRHRPKGRRVAVGTTTLRALESASREGELYPYQGETDLFIYGEYDFKSADALITNFHLPQSSLLLLVCAFGGYDQVMQAYQEAIRTGYRFYSYGDAMLIV